MKLQNHLNNIAKKEILIALFLCLIFFAAYFTLSTIRHHNFQSGYDLAIVDQVIWKYSHLKTPITTVHSYYNTSIFEDHIEIIYLLISPLYWIFSSAYTILFLQALSISSSGMAIFLLARSKNISLFLSISILLSYLSFYGIQFAIWSDVHSLVFAVSFLAFFVYALETKKTKLSVLFFFLSIFCKEDIALLTFFISLVNFYYSKWRINLFFMSFSVIYLLLVFFIYFPYLTRDGYRYDNPNGGIKKDLNLLYMLDTKEKKEAIFYSLLHFGFMPLLAPVYLTVAFVDLAHYFVLGHTLVSSAQGIFGHYRSSQALFLAWSTVVAISKYKFLKKWYVGVYLIFFAAVVQYFLHLPLSYLSKSWLWQTPTQIYDVEKVIAELPENAAVVTQVNILPHVSHRDEVYTMFPESREFILNSPCGRKNCAWFRWGGKPSYLLVDTSNIWDSRHLLTENPNFNEGINNLEKEKVIKLLKRSNTSKLYKITGSVKY